MSNYIDDCIGGSVQMMVYGWTNGRDIGGDLWISASILSSLSIMLNVLIAYSHSIFRAMDLSVSGKNIKA